MANILFQQVTSRFSKTDRQNKKIERIAAFKKKGGSALYQVPKSCKAPENVFEKDSTKLIN